MDKSEIVLFETADKEITLKVTIADESVWLNRNQLADLFERDVKTIGKHIHNALREELDEAVVAKFATTASDGKTYQVEYYNLDMIISVGYRVKSRRGVEFRKWANSVLKQYIIRGYAVNNNRMNQLGEVIQIMKRAEGSLEGKQILSVIERYSKALNLLDSYDHQNMVRPAGNDAIYQTTYEECRELIADMGYGNESELFGKEKDDSFQSSIGSIYQTFEGREIYPTLEGKSSSSTLFHYQKSQFRGWE